MATTFKPAYGAAAAFVVTALVSLTSDTNRLAGWQSAVVDNTGPLSDDELLTGIFKTGTGPTASTTIEVWVYGTVDDAPTYPDRITGVQGIITLTSDNVKNAGLVLACVITVDATTGGLYSMRPVSVASLFSGIMPKKWGVFVVHNTGVAFGTTQILTHIPIQYQSV